MITIKDALCCVVVAFGSASVPVSAGPLTIEFRADRATAEAGETVNWTVWGGLPEGAPTGSCFVEVAAQIVPNHFFTARAQAADAAVLPLAGIVRQYGGGLFDVRMRAPSDIESPALSRVVLMSFSVRIDDPGAPLWYDIEGQIKIASGAGGADAESYERRSGASLEPAFPIHVVTDTVNHPGCSSADIAIPYGELDSADISAFIDLFVSGSPSADIALPFGMIDFADLNRFLETHAAGCRVTR